MSLQNREDRIRESMMSSKIIDTNVEFRIPRAAKQFDPSEHSFKCFCCGGGYKVQKRYFQKTNSPLFQANDGYLPWCKDCTDKYMILLTSLYSNNEEHAIEHFCQQADWVYDIEPLKAAREISSDRSRISHYAAKKNLNVDNRKTYIDTLKYNYTQKQHEIVTSHEQAKADELSVTAKAIDRWGVGFSELDYKNLDDHYRLLKKNNPNCDNNQEIFIKSLCNINMLMIRALRDNDIDKYVKLSDQYSKTFTKAGLKTIEEKDSSNDATVGVTLAVISQYTPEEFYKDKKLYSDHDDIGDYMERHILRPLHNLEYGTDDRDKEFFVKDEDDDDDE